MKKLILLLAGGALVGFVACGPSAEEKKAQEEVLQQKADSEANSLLEKASMAASDSVMAMPADSTHK